MILISTLLFIGYLVWLGVVKILSYTIITYYLIPNSPRLQDISDAFLGNQFTYLAIASFTFVWFMDKIHPLFAVEALTEDHAYKKSGWVILGIQLGAIIVTLLLVPFWITGTYEFFGFNIDLSDYFNQLLSLVLRTVSLLVWIGAEESLFRRRILPKLAKGKRIGFVSANILTALGYASIKMFFFQLDLFYFLTLFLASLWLGVQTMKRDRSLFGTSTWITVLLLLHVVFSQPLFGIEFFGISLLKMKADTLPTFANPTSWMQFLSGGAQGPLSSLAAILFFGILLYSERVEIDLKRLIKKNRTK